MRLVFAGTPAVAVPSLNALLTAGHDVLAVITREDAPLGRKRTLTPSPVAVAAEAAGLPVIRANRLGEEVTAAVLGLEPELGVVVAYGGLVREPLLSGPRHGWVNLHFSLLPRWRGASPVQRALAAGDSVTGAAVFQLVPELDAGDVLGELRRLIGDRDTAGSLLEALSAEGAELLADVVTGIEQGTAQARPQQGEPTFAPKLTLDDARIDWSRPVAAVDAGIRAVTPEPGAFTSVDGVRVKVLDAVPSDLEVPLSSGRIRSVERRVLAGTGSTPLELLRVQPAGRNAMAAADWWRGLNTNEGSAE
ncbi:methionyl-tRNA formyltransferase [Rathayibacter sp. YIM 133350]|uniref:methionyl-tRNA formyltransferase n=1 Tax=Rathayibacter sp. YIM 133350 TaxID=3131992 RepID=UPI00307D5976